MIHPGAARIEKGHVVMPDTFAEGRHLETYEAIDVGGDILLTPSPLDRQRSDRIEGLAERSISDHRKTLEGLAR